MSQASSQKYLRAGRASAASNFAISPMRAASCASPRNRDMLIYFSQRLRASGVVCFSLFSMFFAGAVYAESPVTSGISAQQASSLRDVFGINAPDAQPDADEEFRQRTRQKDLMPRKQH